VPSIVANAMSKLAKFAVSAGLSAIVMASAAHAQPTPDQVARSLGEMEWHASACHLPTAPIEAALDRYIRRTQRGAIEADHLQKEFLAGREEYERVFGSHISCADVAAQIAAVIAKTDRYGLR
jgi:hypothetical protein